jgi:hypothetical protein
MDIDRAESLTIFVGLVNSVDAVNVPDAQILECIENGALGLFSADGRKGARDTDAGMCNRSFGFAIHGASNITAIYTLIGFVVGVAASAVITAFATVITAFARNITLTALTTLTLRGRRAAATVVGTVVGRGHSIDCNEFELFCFIAAY